MFVKNEHVCTFYIDSGMSTNCHFHGVRYDYEHECFSLCVFQFIILKISMDKSGASADPKAQNSGNPHVKLIIIVFCFF